MNGFFDDPLLLQLVLLQAKATIVLAAACATLLVWRNASAARRACIAQLALFAVLLMPAAWLLLPPWHVTAPADIAAAAIAPAALPASATATSTLPSPAAHAATFISWRAIVVGLWLAGAAVLALRLAAGIARLAALDRAAAPVTDPAWQAALATLRSELALRRPVALKLSNQIASPLSWGWLRPAILIDPHTLANAHPRDVIAHELGHVERRDWLALLLARLATALYWFHPLAWLLARRMFDDSERAVDDRVLAGGEPPSRYAATLLAVCSRAPGMPAVAIASSGSLLRQRIAALLEAGRRRSPVSARQYVAGTLLAACCTAPLAALEPAHDAPLPQGFIAGAGAQAARQLDALGNPHFAALAQALRARDFNRRHAQGVAVPFEGRGAVEPLRLAARDPDATVRQLAAWGFSELRYDDTAATVNGLLHDPALAVRGEAARALGDIGAARQAPALVQALRDPSPLVRRQAAHALGDLRIWATRNALEKAAGDADASVQAEARWALKELDGA